MASVTNTIDTIKLPPSAYQVAVTHALTHEFEEIAGLLAGKVMDDHIQIYSIIPLQRTDRKSNRVEVSDTELCTGMLKCDELGRQIGKDISILGWYHSHPHITVFPSEIDLNTQKNFQSMAQNFFGIIFSVFVIAQNNEYQIIEMMGFRTSTNKGKNEGLVLKVVVEPFGPEFPMPENLLSTFIEAWTTVSVRAETEVFDLLKESQSSNADVADALRIFIDILDKVHKPMISCANYMKAGLEQYRNSRKEMSRG